MRRFAQPEEIAAAIAFLSGEINDRAVPGYRQEPDMRENPSTETYVALEFYIDNWRWAGVPFFVRTGKRLAQRMTEISVHFKHTLLTAYADTNAAISAINEAGINYFFLKQPSLGPAYRNCSGLRNIRRSSSFTPPSVK